MMAANHQKGSGYMVNWFGAENLFLCLLDPEMGINDYQRTI